MINSALEKISLIDLAILRLINRRISNKTLNLLIPPLSNKYKFHYLAEILGLYIYYGFLREPENFKRILKIFSEVFTATVILKFIIRHKRPFVHFKDIIDRDSFLPTVGSEEFRINNEAVKKYRNSWYSFPSTEAATSVILLKSLFNPQKSILNTVLISYFSLILFSRMYNGVHRPTEILFGALLGWFWPDNKVKL